MLLHISFFYDISSEHIWMQCAFHGCFFTLLAAFAILLLSCAQCNSCYGTHFFGFTYTRFLYVNNFLCYPLANISFSQSPLQHLSFKWCVFFLSGSKCFLLFYTEMKIKMDCNAQSFRTHVYLSWMSAIMAQEIKWTGNLERYYS